MKKFLVVILSVLIVLIGFIGIRFGSALFQEENTTEIIVSIIKMEFSNNDYEHITDTSHGKMYVLKNNGGSLEEFMGESGWQFKDQMGSGFIFEKDGASVVVVTRLFTKNYTLSIIPDEVFD